MKKQFLIVFYDNPFQLISYKSAEIDVRNSINGITSLWMVSQNSHTETCRLLLYKGTDVNVKTKKTTADSSVTPLFIV